jgi:hypothetical protein
MVTDSFLYTQEQRRLAAARQMRAQFDCGSPEELLCESQLPGHTVWSDWGGKRLAPKQILGEAFVAGAAWQSVAAYDALRSSGLRAANVSVVGANQQAIGARFSRV